MRLSENVWLTGAYYVDFDIHGQLRIVGPHNHLHFGAVGIYRDDLIITEVTSRDGKLVIEAQFKAHELDLADPAIGHIRKVRGFIELPGQQGKATPTFADVMKRHPAALSASYIGVIAGAKHSELIYRRYYGDHWYGVSLEFGPGVAVNRVEKRRRAHLKANAPISFKLVADTDERVEPGIKRVFKTDTQTTESNLVPLLDRAAAEATHLIQYNKTSGFGYGTVFPRDWMESADLGDGDLTPAARLYMYHKSLEHTDDHGQGWHEDIVGEFGVEKVQEAETVTDDLDKLIDRSSQLSQELKTVISQVQQLYVNRTMIDIEPRYLLGLRSLKFADFSIADQEHLRRVAKYVLQQAQTHQLMTFKKVPTMLQRTADEEFSLAGNWRDSEQAFKMVHPVIAPFDVNVVFYPQALAVLADHAGELGVDAADVARAQHKWARVKDWFRFTNPDGTSAMALALYDVQEEGEKLTYRKLEVNHTDEAYDLFYGAPTQSDLASFCQRLLDPQYFYTSSGPLVVGAGDGYDSAQYHGSVIWTKQTAWIVAGLAAQLAKSHLSPKIRQPVNRALAQTAQASIQAWQQLGAIPELHYDDSGKAKAYNEQPITEGPSNTVQLWSAVGARRIIQAYNEATKNGF